VTGVSEHGPGTLFAVRRGLLAAFLLLLCGAAGVLSATVLASNGPLGLLQTTTGATTTAPPITTEPPPPAQIPPGVKISGVLVEYMTADQAELSVGEAFATPVPVRFARRTFALDPNRFAVPQIRRAIAYALTARPGATVRLPVKLRRDRVVAWAAALAKRFDRQPVNSTMRLRNLRPWLTKEQRGRVLDRRAATNAILERLSSHSRRPVVAKALGLRPSVTRLNYGPIVVIRRDSKGLYLYDGMRLSRTFGVATGQSSYPTPIGRWTIVTKARNPWWYPPDSDWARGEQPVPPGPGNPLGTRWMGLSAPGVGIHGTPDSASIGYSASHGCIRMHIPSAEWLFNHVDVGTTVFIVAA
jgi:lipoprotein-anchoring transpeptidase ErfK/SrfK